MTIYRELQESYPTLRGRYQVMTAAGKTESQRHSPLASRSLLAQGLSTLTNILIGILLRTVPTLTSAQVVMMPSLPIPSSQTTLNKQGSTKSLRKENVILVHHGYDSHGFLLLSNNERVWILFTVLLRSAKLKKSAQDLRKLQARGTVF